MEALGAERDPVDARLRQGGRVAALVRAGVRLDRDLRGGRDPEPLSDHVEEVSDDFRRHQGRRPAPEVDRVEGRPGRRAGAIWDAIAR